MPFAPGPRPCTTLLLVPELIVIVGPIASGKSTVAYELGSRFRAADRSVAVLDLDDVVETIGGSLVSRQRGSARPSSSAAS
jgi:adenylylsulfate kinase-like enzyme